MYRINALLSQGDQGLSGTSNGDLKPKVEPVVENSMHLSNLLASDSSGMKSMNTTSAPPTSMAQAIAASTATATTSITPVSSIGVKMEVDPSTVKEEIKTEVKTEAEEEALPSAQFKEEPTAEGTASPKAEPMDENSQNSNLEMKPGSVEPSTSTSQSSKPYHKKGELVSGLEFLCKSLLSVSGQASCFSLILLPFGYGNFNVVSFLASVFDDLDMCRPVYWCLLSVVPELFEWRITIAFICL